jgi:hypothetical protein
MKNLSISSKNDFFAQKEQFLIFTSKQDFIAEILKIRKKLAIPENGLQKSRVSAWQMKHLEANGGRYGKLLTKLLKEFQIHPRWKDAIEHFLLTNASNDSLLPKNLSWQLEENDGSWELKISIFPGFSTKDLIDEWPELKKQLRFSGYPVATKKSASINDQVIIAGRTGYFALKNYKKFKSYTEFENYKKVFELRKEGKSYKEIAIEMGWKKSDYPKVGTYLGKFKKMLKQATLY